MKTYVIGDIHGGLRALQQVLARAPLDVHKDKLIFIGDYVDGWSESADLIDYLIGLKETFTEPIIFIRGNHDNWCEDWLNMGYAPIIWTQQGGQATLDSYIRTGLLVEQSHKDFFKNLQNYYIDEENRIFIHGGWDYKSAPFPESALYPVNAGDNAKECHWDRSLLKNAAAVQIFIDKGNPEYNEKIKKALGQFKEIYIGHTATISTLPENFCNLWNLDSGAGWNGKLTIMDIDTKEYWQSDLVKTLYPDEKGR